MENTKIEKSVNASLTEFLGKPKQQESKKDEVVVEKIEEESITEEPSTELVDPDSIVFEDSIESDGLKYKFDSEDEYEIKDIGRQLFYIGKEIFEIAGVDIQRDYVKKQIMNKKTKKSEKAEWVVSKLHITYKDSEYKSDLPNLKWFKNKETGNWQNPKIELISTREKYNETFTSTIEKLYYTFCIKFGKEPGVFPQEQFFKELVGKKVRLCEDRHSYEGKTYYRLDIFEFV